MRTSPSGLQRGTGARAMRCAAAATWCIPCGIAGTLETDQWLQEATDSRQGPSLTQLLVQCSSASSGAHHPVLMSQPPPWTRSTTLSTEQHRSACSTCTTSALATNLSSDVVLRCVCVAVVVPARCVTCAACWSCTSAGSRVCSATAATTSLSRRWRRCRAHMHSRCGVVAAAPKSAVHQAAALCAPLAGQSCVL